MAISESIYYIVNHVKYFRFNEIDATCEIVGTNSTPNIYFEESVKYDGNFHTVTRIASNAFSHRNDIVTLHIPFGIKCKVNIYFKYCKGLTSINMPNSIDEIGAYAYTDGRSLSKRLILVCHECGRDK